MNQLDQNILDLREEKKLLQSLERLLVNADFKKVILDGFLKSYPLSVVMNRGKLSLEPQESLDIERQLDSVALFNLYLENKISQLADIDVKIHEAETLREQQTIGNIQ